MLPLLQLLLLSTIIYPDIKCSYGFHCWQYTFCQNNLALISSCSTAQPKKGNIPRKNRGNLPVLSHLWSQGTPRSHLALFLGKNIFSWGWGAVLEFTVLPLWCAEGTCIGNIREERQRVAKEPALISLSLSVLISPLCTFVYAWEKGRYSTHIRRKATITKEETCVLIHFSVSWIKMLG